MNKFQHAKLIFMVFLLANIRPGPHDEKQTGIPTINDLVSTIFQKGTLQFTATQAFANNFTFQSHTLFHREPLVVGAEPRLALFVAAVLWLCVSVIVFLFIVGCSIVFVQWKMENSKRGRE